MTRVTTPSDESEPRLDADGLLRNELLLDGLAMCIPMAQVVSIIRRENLADTAGAQQDLALRTIRSLLDDGLIEIGDIVGGSDERVEPWDLPVGAAMDRVYDTFVGNYDQPAMWDLTIWLQLTTTGKRLAAELRAAQRRA